MKIREATPQSTPKGCVMSMPALEDAQLNPPLLIVSSFKMQQAHAKKKNAWHSYSEIYHSITHASPL